jgi:hypothetical protein
MGGMRNAYNILVGKPEGIDHLEGLGVDVNRVGSCGLHLFGSR